MLLFTKMHTKKLSCTTTVQPEGPHTPPRRPTALSDHSPTTLLPLVWPVRQKSCIEHTISTCRQLHSSVYVLHLHEMQSGGSSVKDAGLDVYARNCLYFRSKWNLTISDKNSCILNMQRGITKQTNAHTVFAPPTRRADSLVHRQSEYPVAQTSDSQPPQTSHVESEQITSEWPLKLPTQLNTRNIFVPDLVLVYPNASHVQRLGRCVPAFTLSWELFNCRKD